MSESDARDVLAAALGDERPRLANFVLRGASMAQSDVFSFDLTADVAEQIFEDVRTQAAKLLDRQFLPYDPSYQTSSSQVLVESLSEIPDLEALDREIRTADVSADRGGDDVIAMAHSVGVGARRVVAYRLKGPGIATKRARGLLQLIPRDGVYAPIEEEVLYYEPRFDVFTCGGWAYFTAATIIQTKLNAPEKAQELARNAFQKATQQIEIEGRDLLEKAVVDDPTLRAKMTYVARLLEVDSDYAANLTTENLVKFVKANPDYEILLTRVGRRDVLTFDAAPQHRHKIPRLLADDYLVSQLTRRKYEAGSKHRVTKP